MKFIKTSYQLLIWIFFIQFKIRIQNMQIKQILSENAIAKQHCNESNLKITIKQNQNYINSSKKPQGTEYQTSYLKSIIVKDQQKIYNDQLKSAISLQHKYMPKVYNQKLGKKSGFSFHKTFLIFMFSLSILITSIYFCQLLQNFNLQEKIHQLLTNQQEKSNLKAFQTMNIVKKQEVYIQQQSIKKKALEQHQNYNNINTKSKIQHRYLQEQFTDIDEQKQIQHFQKVILKQIYHVPQTKIIKKNIQPQILYTNVNANVGQKKDYLISQLNLVFKEKVNIENKFIDDVQKFRFSKSNDKPFQQIVDTLKFWTMTGNNISQSKELQEFQELQKTYYQNKYQISKYKEVEICVVVLSYMNKANDRYKRSLDSIVQQDYSNYQVYYVDDNSPDKTGQLVQNYIKDHKLQDKIKLYRNKQRKGKSYNQFYVGQQNCKPGSVMVVMDGDDELIGRQVFKFLSAAYQITGCYYIYTNFLMIDQIKHGVGIGFSVPFPQETIKTRNYRKGILPSHLRTWISDLFLDIKKQDLFINGTFPSIGQDVGTSFQLTQKAGTKVTFFSEFVHRYVIGTGLNDYELNRNGQTEADRYYRKLPKFDIYNKTITLNIKS